MGVDANALPVGVPVKLGMECSSLVVITVSSGK